MITKTIPAIGTRVSVETQYTIEWMNFPKPAIVGVIAPSNPWDQPGTFRVVDREDVFARHKHESVISIDRVKSLTILDPKAVQEPTTQSNLNSFEIKGSKGDLYTVVIDGDKASCNCQAGSHGRLCKHIKTARQMVID
jgi:hypothetical protein